ncbi:MAG: hypothetical protein WDZ30_08735 [Cellvibrionaceae bacterium]
MNSIAKMNTVAKRWLATLVVLSLTSISSHAFDKEAVQAILKSPQRDLVDKIRDPVQNPIEVLEFLGVEAGMQVLDIYAAGGYYTVILSAAVGEEGSVYAQNSPRALDFQEDRTDVTAGEAIASKITAHKLTNVVRMDQPIADINFLPNSLDFVLLSKIFHDYYNRNPRRAHQLLLVLKTALKPGGVIGIIDHHGDPGRDNGRLHRIEKQHVLDAIERAGLVVEAESDLLSNPQDNRRRSIFDPIMNGNTDRFLLKVVSPPRSTD